MGESDHTLPTGTVTFLFSDIEDSTRLAHELDTAAYRELLEQHHRLLRSTFGAHGGTERGTQGDSFLVIFRDAPSAVAAAIDAQRSLAAAEWPSGADVRVRMGLHSGQGIAGGDDYVGLDINLAARIASAAHGGQVLLSDSTRALAARDLPAGAGLRDVGQHRLKGFEEPERLHQLVIQDLPSDFPPPRGVRPGGGNVPARLLSFVGRRAETDELRRLVAENPLITLVGPGGTGKTSLAIEVAREAAAEFSDGAWFVALDALSDPGLVGSAIVAALGLRDLSGRSARDRLVDNLSDRALLLVLDNFEQVLDAAPLVGDLMAAGPRVRIIVTSRAPLHLAVEQVYPVAPLSVPDDGETLEPAELEVVPSVQLFVDRARRAQPSFELTPDNAASIVDICRRLDGLPLGIELAAARIRVLGVAGIRDRLAQRLGLPELPARDVPARQRTLRDAIAWSHDLLEPAEQGLLARLSVFAGGCQLAEAEAVCRPATDTGDAVADGLTKLVDHSLVTATDRGAAVRFGMLETIREFADEHLAADERPGLLHRHARAYLALVEESAPRLFGREGAAAFDRVGEEWNNLSAAIHWSIDAGDAEMALRFGAATWRFWSLRGEMETGRSTIAAVLEMAGADAPTSARMRALEAMGGILFYAADNDGASRNYHAQLDLARQLGDLRGMADAQFNLAFTLDLRGRLDGGQALIDEIADSYLAAGDEVGVARTGLLQANLLRDTGRMDEARAAAERAIGRFRELGDLQYELMAAGGLAGFCLQMGDREAAIRWFLVALVRMDERGDAAGATVALPLMAAAVLTIVGAEPAATILGAYDALSRRYGIKMPRGLEEVVEMQDPRAAARVALDQATFDAAIRRGAEMTPKEAVEFVIETLRGVYPVETTG
ncbi:MAG TPA: adenylate/guanylate cyclase domain-containing protein [Candidatus Limnocylindrales bacterium]|jgi:predicted ATPase/class 3 adenylate cyclase